MNNLALLETSTIYEWIKLHALVTEGARNVPLKVHAPVKGQIKSNHLKSFPLNKSTQMLVKS